MSAPASMLNTTAPPWRVLIVDDSRDDAELAEIALRDAGLAVECQRVCSGDRMRTALVEFAPHLVLSDVNIPGFSGEEALELVRSHNPALPFVFLTGSLLAPDSAPPRAEGLLLKDDMQELPRLVQELLPQR